MQTFIRNAAGKALVDSPALNPASRQVLVPLARAAPPVAVRVPGPGPMEPSRDRSVDSASKPIPPAPTGSDSLDLVEASSSADHGDDGGDGEEEYITARGVDGDPYANLDNAFGGYSGDDPKPHTDNGLF